MGLVQVTTFAAGSLAAGLAVSPAIHAFLRQGQVLDVPNHRSSHTRVTVRGGGLLCMAAVSLVAVVASLLRADVPWLPIGAALVLSAVGFLDDTRGLSAPLRLFTQAALGAGVGLAVGDGAWTSVVVGVIAYPIAVNAVNFMDGIDGITSLTISAWGLVVIAAGSAVVGDSAVAIAALALGAALAFLPWNVPKALMFMGDSGSYLFGGLIAGAATSALATGPSGWVVVTPLAVYLLDTGYTLVRRALRHQRLLEAHREHLYQRLQTAIGCRHWPVSLAVGLMALAIGLAWVHLPPVGAATVTLVFLAMYVAGTEALWTSRALQKVA